MKKVSPLVLVALFAASAAHAMLVREKFVTDPARDGWQVFGNPNLFHWNPTNQNIEVTWDSSQTNSYFFHPLGKTFTQADSFCVLFDLQLSNTVVTGYANEVAVGLLHFADATSPDFNRANSPLPNLF